MKKTKKVSQKERINQKVMNQHERLVNRLSKAEPNTDEYDEILKELKDFECIQREKEKTQNDNKDSKRAHIGKALVNGGVTILTALGLANVEATKPLIGKTFDAFVKNIFRKP